MMIVQWVIALLLLIFMIWYSRIVKKYLFETINLKPKLLRLISFSFLPILLLIFLSFVSLFCKDWTSQLAIFLMKHYTEILDTHTCIYYISNIIRLITSFINLIIPTVLLAFYFIKWDLKAIFFILLYMVFFAFTWTWNLFLLNNTSGNLLEISLLQDMAENYFTFAYEFTKNEIGEIADWLPFIFFIIILFFNRDTKAVKS